MASEMASLTLVGQSSSHSARLEFGRQPRDDGTDGETESPRTTLGGEIPRAEPLRRDRDQGTKADHRRDPKASPKNSPKAQCQICRKLKLILNELSAGDHDHFNSGDQGKAPHRFRRCGALEWWGD
jgi:hypothetical protein